METAKAILELVSNREDIKLTLDLETLAALIEQNAVDLDPEHLTIIASFQLRKRAVETKLIFEDAPVETDATLIKNIANAHQLYADPKAGKTILKIAKANDISKRRIQQLIELAFLAPDITKTVLDGSQPIGFTSDWCKRHTFPSDWQALRALSATL